MVVDAKCTNCGIDIEVDENKEADICPRCGTAFITEKVINNYKTSDNGELKIIGYNEWFLIKPSIEIYMDDVYIGSVAYKDEITIPIKKDCLVKLKCSIREVSFYAKKNLKQTIKVSWNRKTGGILLCQ